MAERRGTDPQLEAAIDDALADLAHGEPSAGFESRVLDALEGRRPRVARPIVWAPLLAAAAVTAVWLLRPSTPAPASRPGAPPHAALAEAPPEPAPPAPATRATEGPRATRGPRVVRPPWTGRDEGGGRDFIDAIELAEVDVRPIAPPSAIARPAPLAIDHGTTERISVPPITVESLSDVFQEEKR